ncbi:metallophosphoesterase family protein [Vibrio mangrovi]|uniref:Cyclic 3',5'-adenosine monophosphate phosphodiesterase n=1 Tax=Vibrio mangrovi TaxID=474394 RepID=A0A1Y6IQI5_9VIBR|nr:metallophosphoesterase [Vibrio mangrovi]MDW6003302.1 metallophosphoesterase [Vibrio mangrovi]SMR99909.1 cyclic 3',5'-adenosine monophosphate phosphodiesterase [Vibrio mangrovi]
MKLLILSDLHVGSKARAQDFSTSPDDMACRNTPDFFKDFSELIKKESIDVTHILIAGDITQTAAYNEFELAAKNIEAIADLLQVGKECIYFIPGNHDSNWNDEKSSIENNEPTELTIKKKYTNLEQNKFFANLLGNAVFQDMYSSPYGSIWNSEEIVIVGINSSVRDGTTSDVHHGSIEPNDLNKINGELDKLDTKNKVKVLLTHHHPKNYTDRTFQDSDFSIMQNADAFLRFATTNEFDVIVHGHKHIPRFDIHSDALNYPVVALSAGSFSASLKDYHNGVANFFHIIEVEGKCDKNDNILGKVTTWAYFDNNKWISANKERDYISHEEFFGDIRNRKVLKKELKHDIETQIETTNVFRWQTLLNKKPELKYCNLGLREIVITELCEEEGWEYLPMRNNDFLVVQEDSSV